MTQRLRFRRSQRLHAAAVTAALKSGGAKRTDRFRMSIRRNSLTYGRLATIVPKRFAALAVVRNRIRRLIREAFRVHQHRFRACDVVIRLVAPVNEQAVTMAEVEALLLKGGHG